MRKYLFFIPFLILSACRPDPVKLPDSVYIPTGADIQMLDSLQYKAFLYFLHEINPENGLVKDRSTDDSPATIAAMGFALPAWAIGVERGWISRTEAERLTLNMLRFLMNSEQSRDSLATGYKGFYYHFLHMQTGQRYWASELSTVDTAWLLAGVRFASAWYKGDSAVEIEIRDLCQAITNRVEWEFSLMPAGGENDSSVSMGWKPESGQHPMGWIGYNEAQYIYILAAGSGYKYAARGYQTWLKNYRWYEPWPGLAQAAFPPMFAHQFTQLFLDLRGWQDAFTRRRGLDYFENSRRAAYAQRQYAIENPQKMAGYDSLTWGITACDGPGEKYNSGNHKFHGYAGRGASGPDYFYFDDGTLAPTALLGSVVFAPEIIIPSMRSMIERFGRKGLLGRYGTVDAFNLTADWYADQFLGLDQGPIVLMIENLRSGLVWKTCMSDPLIQKGLAVISQVEIEEQK